MFPIECVLWTIQRILWPIENVLQAHQHVLSGFIYIRRVECKVTMGAWHLGPRRRIWLASHSRGQQLGLGAADHFHCAKLEKGNTTRAWPRVEFDIQSVDQYPGNCHGHHQGQRVVLAGFNPTADKCSRTRHTTASLDCRIFFCMLFNMFSGP